MVPTPPSKPIRLLAQMFALFLAFGCGEKIIEIEKEVPVPDILEVRQILLRAEKHVSWRGDSSGAVVVVSATNRSRQDWIGRFEFSLYGARAMDATDRTIVTEESAPLIATRYGMFTDRFTGSTPEGDSLAWAVPAGEQRYIYAFCPADWEAWELVWASWVFRRDVSVPKEGLRKRMLSFAE